MYRHLTNPHIDQVRAGRDWLLSILAQHDCRPPRAWMRRPGSVWRCACGKAWRLARKSGTARRWYRAGDYDSEEV